MAKSILDTTKKALGLDATNTEFDVDIIMHINSVFSTLNDLGIGPAEGFAIEDATPTWDDYIPANPRYNSVQSYMYLKVRMLFDPPATSFHITAIQKQIDEYEWRLNVKYENDTWVPPVEPVDPTLAETVDGVWV